MLTFEEVATLADRPVVNLHRAVVIEWLSVPGLVYQVQWADTIDSNTWHDLGDTRTGRGGNTRVVHVVREQDKMFYRIISP